MAHIYILLGGNLGDVKETFNQAKKQMTEKIGPIVGQSSLYQSEAWGFESDNHFLNQVVELESPLSAQEILNVLLAIETSLGRIRNPKHEGYASRPIDLDILYVHQLVIKEQQLQVPHPAIAERRFTLLPLAELAPHFVHPVNNKTQSQLLLDCPDQSEVKKL